MTAVLTIDDTRLGRPPQLLFHLTALILIVLVLLSGMMLARFGIRYELEGGSVLEKIHPAHWLALASVLLLALADRGGASFLERLFADHKGSLLFLVTWTLLLFHIIVVQKQPFTPVIDTFLLPVLLLFIIAHQGFGHRLRLARLVHLLMFANSLLGIVEVATGFRLTPLDVGGFVVEDDWRATALIGHPLANAILTGFYLIILAQGGWRGLPWALRPVVFLTALLAMSAFGGRMAFLALLPFLAVIATGKLAGILRGNRSPRRNWVLAALLLPLFLVLLVLGAEFGLFDRFIERFISDRGSASARFIMLEVFSDLSWFDILVGPDPELLQTLLRAYGLNFGIESFWLAFILSYGLVVSMLFFAGLLLFLADVVRVAGSKAVWPLLYFFIVASTYVSLSAKNTDFALAIAMLVLLLSTRERAGEPPSYTLAKGARP